MDLSKTQRSMHHKVLKRCLELASRTTPNIFEVSRSQSQSVIIITFGGNLNYFISSLIDFLTKTNFSPHLLTQPNLKLQIGFLKLLVIIVR